jgi:hypothetical protein
MGSKASWSCEGLKSRGASQQVVAAMHIEEGPQRPVSQVQQVHWLLPDKTFVVMCSAAAARVDLA